MNTVFFIAAGVAIIATFRVVTCSNAVHALLYLVLSFLSIAHIFYILGAPFIAALEVIVYAGAIMVLFLIAIMVIETGKQSIQVERRLRDSQRWLGPGILAVILLGLMVWTILQKHATDTVPQYVAAKDVGVSLFGPYLVGVQLAALLLLVGLIGASHLGRHKRSREEEREGGQP